MKDSHYRISLDIHSTQSQVSLPVKQGDTSRKVFISLCEGGKPYQIEKDCFAVFSAKKPDKTVIENNCVIADNVIEYAFTEQTTAVSGMIACEIKLYGGNSGLITSPRFTVIVDARAVSDADIESTSEYSALTALYTDTISAKNNANTAADEANAKAKLAGDAAANAEVATFKANEARDGAYLATSEANEARDVANAAAANANDKANLVNTATANANTATSEANKARDNANAAADNANTVATGIRNSVSNALKGSASGNPIRLDDVSPVEHTAKVQVHGKNLFDISKIETYNHITNNGDGTLTVNPDSNSSGTSSNKALKRIAPQLKVGDVCTLTATTTGTAKHIYLSSFGIWNFETSLKITQEILDSTVYFYASGVNTTAVVSNIQIEKGTTATEYEPYLDPSTVTVSRCGKNLIDTSAMVNSQLIDNGNNTFTLTKASDTNRKGKPISVYIPSGSVVTLSAKVLSNEANANLYLVFESSDKTTREIIITETSSQSRTLAKDCVKLYVSLAYAAENGTGITFSDFQLEIGATGTEYEAYKGATYTPNADGTVDGVTSLYPTTTLLTDTDGVTIDAEYNKDANKVIDELLGLIIHKSFVTDVTIFANKWVGTSSPYSQIVTVEGATNRSQVDLTPSAEQLSIFHNKDLAFVTENYNGVITVYAIGQKPTNDYTIQATVTEVNV